MDSRDHYEVIGSMNKIRCPYCGRIKDTPPDGKYICVRCGHKLFILKGKTVSYSQHNDPSDEKHLSKVQCPHCKKGFLTKADSYSECSSCGNRYIINHKGKIISYGFDSTFSIYLYILFGLLALAIFSGIIFPRHGVFCFVVTIFLLGLLEFSISIHAVIIGTIHFRQSQTHVDKSPLMFWIEVLFHFGLGIFFFSRFIV